VGAAAKALSWVDLKDNYFTKNEHNIEIKKRCKKQRGPRIYTLLLSTDDAAPAGLEYRTRE
jgi:hypothetical protein